MNNSVNEKNNFIIIWSVCLVLLFAFVFVGGNSSVTIKGTRADACSNFITESACKNNTNNCTWVPDKYESSCNGIYYVSGDAHNCNELGETECLEKANLGYCSWERKKVTKAYCTSSGGDSSGDDSSGSGGSTCAGGSFKNTLTGQCELCPAGYYCKDGNKTKCPGGQYSQAGASSCLTCSDGLVPNLAQTACIDSSVDNPNCTNGNATTCPAGKYLYKDAYLCGSCLPCSGNNYCPGGTSSFRECPEGSSPNAEHTACVSDNNENPNCTGTQPTSCPAGKYLKKDANLCKSCVNCPSGKVCRGGTDAPTSCSAGTVPNSTQTACVPTGTTPDDGNKDDNDDGDTCKYSDQVDADVAAAIDCGNKNREFQSVEKDGCWSYSCTTCKSGYTETNGSCVAPIAATQAGCYNCKGEIKWIDVGASLAGCSTTPTTCPSGGGGSGIGGSTGGTGSSGDSGNSGSNDDSGNSDDSDNGGSNESNNNSGAGNNNVGSNNSNNGNSNNSDGTNTNSNPQTGNITIFLVLVVGFTMAGYAIYYYSVLKKSIM